MKDVRRSVAGAAMSGALAVFTALAPAEAAEPVDEFRVGNIWKGSAGFYGPGNSFSGCDMTATFPEGLVLSFSLNAKGVLGLGMSGPDDMSLSSGKVPTTLSVDGSVLRMVAMEADDDALMFDELWLDAVLGPAGDYLPALKRGKSITLAMQGQTVDKPSKNRVWTYTAALTGAAEAFQALEACVAKYATGGRPAAAPGTATKAARYGAIAMGQDDEEAVLTGVSDDQPSLALAAKDAIATCRKAGKGKTTCEIIVAMDRIVPCGAVAASYDKQRGWTHGWSAGQTGDAASEGAMQACREKGGTDCEVNIERCLTP